MKKILMILMAVALVVLPTTAQNFGDQEQPRAQFQSTSVMQRSGSVYASQPAINDDGTAYNPSLTTQTQTQTPSGPRKVAPKDGGDTDFPVGDAVLPLMLMALAFCGIVALRRRRALNR